MNFGFSEAHQMLQEMLRDFTRNEIEPRDKWMDENGFDHALHAKMAEAGIFTIPFDRKYGGAGFDYLAATMAIEEVAKGSASVAIGLDSMWLAADVINMFGSPEQKDLYLPLAAQGKRICFALTESCGGSDAAAIRSTAVKTDDGWLLNGSKAWITNSNAEYCIVLAKTDPNAGARGISAFIVPHEAEGLTVGEHEDKMGLRGSFTGEISFDNVRLPENALVGELGKGFKYAMTALDAARISIAAISLGLAEHAMEIAKNYANERIAFGKPISRFEGIQFKFADMASRIYAMRLMVYDVAKAKAEGRRFTLEAAQTKLLCTTWATQICLEAQQVLGGNGCSREFHVERLVRDAKMNEIAEGTSEIQRMIIGTTVLAGK